MKSLKTYIQEGLSSNNTVFPNIDPTKFEWKRQYADDDYQFKCKSEVNKIARELYPNTAPMDCVEKLYIDTYKLYCKNNPRMKDKDIEESLEKHIRIINRYGWGTFESQSLPQGWWVFICWAYENSK